MQQQIEVKSNEELITYFLTTKNYSEATKHSYQLDINHFITAMAIENLQQVTTKTIFEYETQLKQNELIGVERKRRLLAAVRSFYKFYRRIAKIYDNYCFIEFPEFEDRISFTEESAGLRSNKELTLSLDELKDFLRRLQCYNFTHYLIALFMAGSGLRIGDTLNIEIHNIDFGMQKVRTKTKKGIREYYFSKLVKHALLRYLKQREQIFPASPWLFVDAEGQKIKAKSYTRIFKGIIRRLMCGTCRQYRTTETQCWSCRSGFSCHSLRRTFSTIRRRMKQDKDDLAFLLGHTTDVTWRYLKLTDEEKLAIYLAYDFLAEV
jgi:integrase